MKLRRWMRPVAFVCALVIHLPGCYSWHTTSLRPETVPDPSESWRLTLADGNHLVLRGVAFGNDSVKGMHTGPRHEIITVPIRDVRRAEVRGSVNVLKTTAFVLGLVAAGVIIGGWVYQDPLEEF